MSRGNGNVIPFGRRQAAAAPAMMQCPMSASIALSEAIAMLWELREQLQAATAMSKLQRTRFNSLGRHIEDRLEHALHSMERMP